MSNEKDDEQWAVVVAWVMVALYITSVFFIFVLGLLPYRHHHCQPLAESRVLYLQIEHIDQEIALLKNEVELMVLEQELGLLKRELKHLEEELE